MSIKFDRTLYLTNTLKIQSHLEAILRETTLHPLLLPKPNKANTGRSLLFILLSLEFMKMQIFLKLKN
jgi:hypothetical protein